MEVFCNFIVSMSIFWLFCKILPLIECTWDLSVCLTAVMWIYNDRDAWISMLNITSKWTWKAEYQALPTPAESEASFEPYPQGIRMHLKVWAACASPGFPLYPRDTEFVKSLEQLFFTPTFVVTYLNIKVTYVHSRMSRKPWFYFLFCTFVSECALFSWKHSFPFVSFFCLRM